MIIKITKLRRDQYGVLRSRFRSLLETKNIDFIEEIPKGLSGIAKSRIVLKSGITLYVMESLDELERLMKGKRND